MFKYCCTYFSNPMNMVNIGEIDAYIPRSGPWFSSYVQPVCVMSFGTCQFCGCTEIIKKKSELHFKNWYELVFASFPGTHHSTKDRY